MKFFLVKDGDDAACIMQRTGDKKSSGYSSSIPLYRSTTRNLDIIPMSREPSEVEKCALLKKFLESEVSNPREGFWSCKVEVGVAPEFTSTTIKVARPRSLEVFKRTSSERDCVAQLGRSFERSRIQVDWNIMDGDGPAGGLSTREMDLCGARVFYESRTLGCLPKMNQLDLWVKPSQTIFARMTITVTIPDDIFMLRCGSNPAPMSVTILKEEVLSDVTIVCRDGTEVRAHRNFLAARSSVFTAMFQTDMKEARESILELADMEAKSVRAFLKYLYFSDTKDAKKDFQVAFELFQAGHKYGIQFLEEGMRGLIAGQPNSWFSLEAAVKLFLFARNVTPTDELLKMKMAKVLKLRFATLEDSPVMQELFRNDHKAALELVKYIAMLK